jgi:outer membrane receptor protein involved in Fe transport
MHGRRLQFALLISASVLANVSFAGEGDLDEVVVTGTRIARPDFISASPILSVTTERFDQASANTADAVLNTLPQFVPSYGSTSNNPANGGQANLSLRGLPNTATLVLLDGRRLMPANGSGVPDINIVPPALIESVEVITGGASAVYGSDAIAGVVNFKLRHKFDGVELDTMGAVTQEGDGQDYSFSVAGGTNFADHRGSLLGFVGYSKRELVTYADRTFSQYGLSWIGPGFGTLGPQQGFVASGSPNIPEGKALIDSVSPQAFADLFNSYGTPVRFQPFISFNEDRTLFTTGNVRPRRPGNVANFRGVKDPVLYNTVVYGFNFAPYNALQLPLERWSAFGRGEFDLNESAQLYAQVLYTTYSVMMQLAPTPVNDVTIPVTNPYIPRDLATLLATRPDPTAPFAFSKRILGIGPRIADDQYDVAQVTAGLKGRLGGGWRYDAYVQIGRNHDDEQQSNNILRSKYMDLTYAADGGAALCGGYDPFGLAPISQACADYIAVNGMNRSEVIQDIAEASANGSVFELPAGDVQLAVGAMYKRDQFTYRSDPISKVFLDDGISDIQGFNPALDIAGKDHNTDVYFEASIPLLRNTTGAKSLDAVIGYRFSDYASAGAVDAYKAELLYQPVEPLRFRGSFQRAVRAPSVYELYLPQLGPTVGLDEQEPDPCVADSSARNGPNAVQVTALCAAQGIPLNVLPTYAYDRGDANGVSGGNPDLKPETAETLTAGVVLRPSLDNRWLRGLQLSVDWYRIDVTQAILQPPVYEAVTRCYDAAYNPSFSVDNTYCQYFRRSTTTGNIIDAKEIYRNVGSLLTSGIDFQVDWRIEAGPGTVAANWLVSYLDNFQVADGPGPVDEWSGTIGGGVGNALPRWKWNMRIDYAWSGIDVGGQWRHVTAMEDADPTFKFSVPARSYFDLFAGYDIDSGALAGLSLHAGVENVANTDPPIFPTYVQANTDPSQYDTLGRRYYLRASYRF